MLKGRWPTGASQQSSPRIQGRIVLRPASGRAAAGLEFFESQSRAPFHDHRFPESREAGLLRGANDCLPWRSAFTPEGDQRQSLRRRGDSGALHESYPWEVCQRGRTQQAQFLLWPRIKDSATAQTANADSYQESLRVPRQNERYALAGVAAF